MEILEHLPEESTKQYVHRNLIYNIVNINLKPGEKVIEQELCDAFHISRTPLREAILALHKDHLVDIYSKRGTYVSYIDESIVEEVRQLRAVLESEIARIACHTLNSDAIDLLRENIVVWRYYIEKGQKKKIFELDKKFHSMLYKMCGKQYWSELVESVAPHFDRTTVLSFHCCPASHILLDHEQLVDAIESKNETGAYTIARQHMERYCENLVSMKNTYPQYFKEKTKIS